MSKKIKSMLKRYGTAAVSTALDGALDTRLPPKPLTMSAPIVDAEQKADKKRAGHNAAERRVRKIVGEVHSAIGLVLDGAAALASLSPIEVLGLSEYIAGQVQQDGFRDELARRGFAIYADRYAQGLALTLLGVPPRRRTGRRPAASRLRAGRSPLGR